MTDDLPLRRRVHGDKRRYMVFVLWLHGATQTTIANVVGLRRKQVAGIVDRSDYRNRSALTIEQRNRFLSELAAIRCGDDDRMIDEGVLPEAVFTAKAI